MRLKVCDVELTASRPAVIPLDGADGLLALLRCEGRPVGLVRVPGSGSQVDAAALRAALPSGACLDAVAAGPPSPPSPISIVVCTRERPEDLRRCLASLMPLVRSGHEVIVVDNTAGDASAAAVSATHGMRYVAEPTPGLDRARNRGLEAARHPIVAFTDDDVVVDAGWAEAIAAPFADPRIGAVTGLVVPLELETAAQSAFEVYCAPRRSFARRTFAAPAIAPAEGGLAGMGANMAFRRTLLDRLGGFDPRLDAGTATCSGGDTDMFARVLQSGAAIVYTPDAFVRHRHRPDQPALHACVGGYGAGLFAFLTKRVVEEADLRAAVVAARWFIGPFVKAGGRRLRGEPAVPFSLLLAEAAGALSGPYRYWQERRRGR